MRSVFSNIYRKTIRTLKVTGMVAAASLLSFYGVSANDEVTESIPPEMPDPNTATIEEITEYMRAKEV